MSSNKSITPSVRSATASGASNGFQVKRITPGYPLTSDFRHFGLRAFPASGQTLAPPALRYRRVEDQAEVAWLTPRAQEYETERGLWGRPGGHFAHGLVLGPTELAAIEDWPAGLFGLPFWRRSDPEPSRGRLPDPVELTGDQLRRFPDREVHGFDLSEMEPGFFAVLLTAIARVTREGQTLFLIDDPERLVDAAGSHEG